MITCQTIKSSLSQCTISKSRKRCECQVPKANRTCIWQRKTTLTKSNNQVKGFLKFPERFKYTTTSAIYKGYALSNLLAFAQILKNPNPTTMKCLANEYTQIIVYWELRHRIRKAISETSMVSSWNNADYFLHLLVLF